MLEKCCPCLLRSKGIRGHFSIGQGRNWHSRYALALSTPPARRCLHCAHPKHPVPGVSWYALPLSALPESAPLSAKRWKKTLKGILPHGIEALGACYVEGDGLIVLRAATVDTRS